VSFSGGTFRLLTGRHQVPGTVERERIIYYFDSFFIKKMQDYTFVSTEVEGTHDCTRGSLSSVTTASINNISVPQPALLLLIEQLLPIAGLKLMFLDISLENILADGWK